ncbi:MAG TPA: hypothetical protein DCG69_08610 [Bacteroidales bacterium]|nr:hypothetical protein [Bacteroidales bacterium]
MAQRRRIRFPDSLKGLAILLMIQVHLMELFAKQEIYDSLLGKISLFLGGIPAAPVFMLVMGYFVAFGKKKPAEMTLRGIKLFFGGLLLNIGLNLHLLYNIFFKNWDYNPWHFIFGADILPLAGLSLISLAFLQKISVRKYWIYFVLAFVVAALSQFFTPLQFETHSFGYLLTFFVGGTSWSYFPLIPWLAYPLLGFGFKLMNDELNLSGFLQKTRFKLIIAMLALILAFTIQYGLNSSSNLPIYYHHNFLFFLWAVAFMLVWFSAFYFIERKFRHTLVFFYLQFVGKNVTAIYIIQWLIIGNIATAIYKTQELDQYLFWFLNITIVSSVLAYIWIKIRNSKAPSK